jgi:DNA-binding LacI/PurR family transcriptional regulator
MSGPGRAPVLADVAERAGVSAMTVSRVLNGYPGVADATRARVEQAVAELGYRANTAARTLAGGRSRTLGVVGVETPYYGPSNVVFAIEAAAREAGHSVSLVTLKRTDVAEMRAALDRLRLAHADGVIVLAPINAAVDAVATLHADVPHVIASADPTAGLATVAIDQEAGARLATRHLLDLGHRTVHHVRGPRSWIDAGARAAAWRRELRESGRPMGHCITGDWSPHAGYEAGRRLAADPDVTAVFAANDQMALGVLRALHEAGRAVPGEVSVVGFDDTPESAYYTPPLTTVRQDLREVGRRCVELVLGIIAGDETERHVAVAPDLVVRSTTAAPA